MKLDNEFALENEKILRLNSNIVKWYDFDENGEVLIIGDGAEEISRFLADKVSQITVIEKDSEKYNNLVAISIMLKNMTVIKGDFSEAKLNNKFRYIILLGCLSFQSEDKENADFMKKAKSLLKNDGTILLAVNNCISLKFLSEFDNTTPLSGLSKFRLESILEQANLNNYKFYYPLPNYQIANVIFSDEFLPSSVDLERNIDLKQKVSEKNFDDRKILAEIAENSQYDFKYYCNSFLVEISNDEIKNDVRAIYFNNVRKEKYQLVTKILDDKVLKYSATQESVSHLKNIFHNINILNEIQINTLDSFNAEKIISQYVKNGVTLQDIFLRNFKLNRFGEIEKIIERYKNEILLKLQVGNSENNIFQKYNVEISAEKLNKLTFVKHGFWDLILQNIFVIDNEFYIYDQEWYEENVPIEFIVYRAIMYLAKLTNDDKNKLYELLKIDEYLDEFFKLENTLQEGLLDKEECLYYSNDIRSYENIYINEKEILSLKLEEKNQEINALNNEKNQLINELKNEKNQKIDEYEKEINFKQGIIDSKEMMNSYISKELKNFSTAYYVVNKEIAKLQQQLQLKNEEVNNIVNSQQFIQGAISLRRRQQLYPIVVTIRGIKNIVQKVFVPVKRAILSAVRKIGKTAYELYPVKAHKRNIKNKFLYSNKLSKLGNVTTYEQYCVNPPDVLLYEDGRQEACVKYQVGLNKTIGIHLHLFYEDLLDEFYTYFCNIPYTFDLYVSVMKGANVNKIYNKFNKILNLNKVKVVETPNSGRDFGAMFVEFREDLKQYDYVMHVHSKKSLRVGAEQSAWRRHMLDNLLGSTERIMKHFYLLEQMNYGMVYVDHHKDSCPFWATTWLGEAPLARNLLNKMGIEFKDEFLQFPAGSMFWAKKDALRQLFDLELTWDDFGYEKDGNTEKNLAYVFERITGKVAKFNGYDLAIYNSYENRYRKNIGESSFQVYYGYDKNRVTEMSYPFDIVTFDIFDTLITRNIYTPDDSFKIIQNRIKAKNIKLEDYVSLRKQAEFNVRKNKNFEGDCNIHEIYEEFQKITGLSTEEVEVIKQTEIDTEYELVIPRKEMLEVYNRLLQRNKKIILISDMYLTKEMIAKMLRKCGYDNWFDLIISSEVGYRKDNETMWKYFFEKYPNCTTLHMGDNEFADAHALAKIARPHFNVIRGTKLNTVMEQRYVKEDEQLNLLESIIMGSIINRVACNSPFVMHDIDKKSIINNYFDFGYAVLGPIIFNYMLWIVKMAKEEKKGEVLLFAAREGYYLQKIYNIFKEKLNILKDVEDHYLYISRRAVTVQNINTIDDVREIMERWFQGTVREVLYYRLNYKDDNFDDQIITLPQDINIVMDIVEKNFDKILANAKKEKSSYLKYVDSLNIDFENKKVTMIDLGYAGTAQYYLAKLLNKKIAGKYFCVQSDLKPIQIGCDVYSCYNKNIYSKSIDHNILYKNSLLLEAFLTAPDGQFLYMNEENDKFIPNFLHEPNKKIQMEKLDEVYRGVKEFTETILDLLGDSVFDYEIDKKYIYRCYEICLDESAKFDNEMKSLFLIEDYYCSTAVLDGLDIIKRREKDWNYD